jgi:cytochrome P450
MAIYPEVTRKLRAEVLAQCGSSGSITYEQLRNLKYMRAVINETLRLFPPVPLNVRESRPTGCTLPPSDPTFASTSLGSDDDPRAFYMPGSTPIYFLPLLTQRNPELWGPDANEFDPDRWLEGERLSRFVSNPTMYTPFSAGPRVCLGQNYAYNEASFFLVRLLQQFDTFSLATEAQPEGSLPPLEWKHRKGRQVDEKIWPAAALTLFVKVSSFFLTHMEIPMY